VAEFGLHPRHLRRIGVVALVVGMVGMAALIVVLNMIDARLGRIERDGQPVSADVVATDGRGEGGTITIEFRSPTGVRTEVVRLDGGSPSYEVGQRLDVKVMSTDPAEFVVPGERNLSRRTSSILIWFTTVALGALVTGLLMLVTSWWLGRRGRRSIQHPS
jgi:hypothetical protein